MLPTRFVFVRGLRLLLVFALAAVPGAFVGDGVAERADWERLAAQDDAWYRSAEGRHAVRVILQRQKSSGGWEKNYDLTEPVDASDNADPGKEPGTIDNNATVGELRVLARYHQLTGDEAVKQAVLCGLAFLIEAQYDHGGWPQYYPLVGGYHDAITYNDDAMYRVAELMRDIAEGKEPFAFLGEAAREQAHASYERAIGVILRTQIVVNGQPTVWCAQHDAETLAPTKARSYELASLSGAESVRLVQLLMQIDEPSPEVIHAVQSAVRWFHDHVVTGVDYQRIRDDQGKEDRRLVQTGNPSDRWWPRFADLETGEPVFCGRDGVPRSQLGDVELERRLGYAWYTRRAVALLDNDYPAWQQRWAPHENVLSTSD